MRANPVPNMETQVEPTPATVDSEVTDCYFLDAKIALACALQSNTLATPDAGERLQLCYYDGDAVEGAPLNMIQVPSSNYCGFFIDTSLPIPRQVVCLDNHDADAVANIENVFKDLNAQIDSVRQQASKITHQLPVHKDSYFLDPRVAFHTAMQQNRVILNHPTITGLQVCYYDGEALQGGPDNLINVRLEQALDYFSTCRLRVPQKLVLPAHFDDATRHQINATFDDLLHQVNKNREQSTIALALTMKSHSPRLRADEKPRVFLPTTRVSTVMQHVSHSMARAFDKLGFETLVCIEKSDMEYMTPLLQQSEFTNFDPHIVFSINFLNNQLLNDEIFNLVWYQDPMPQIVEGRPITRRPRDLFIGLPDCCDLLRQCGIDDAISTHHCVDTDRFRPNPAIKRENKIVFAGTNIDGYDIIASEQRQATESAITQLYQLIDSDAPLTHQSIDAITENSGLPRYFVYNRLFYQCVRNRTLQWLCQQDEVAVEIYGAGWDNDPVIAQHAKGTVAHDKLADIYASAKYAFIPASDNLHLLRLGEVAAAGCIPLSFDIRQLTAPPLWEQEIINFRNAQQLAHALRQQPSGDPSAIADAMSCDHLLQRVFSRLLQQHPDFQTLIDHAAKSFPPKV